MFKEGLIDTYVNGFHDDKYGTIVENAIRNHSAFRIDERLDDYTVMSVSYTHLDVYKRQEQMSTDRKSRKRLRQPEFHRRSM